MGNNNSKKINVKCLSLFSEWNSYMNAIFEKRWSHMFSIDGLSAEVRIKWMSVSDDLGG